MASMAPIIITFTVSKMKKSKLSLTRPPKGYAFDEIARHMATSVWHNKTTLEIIANHKIKIKQII